MDIDLTCNEELQLITNVLDPQPVKSRPKSDDLPPVEENREVLQQPVNRPQSPDYRHKRFDKEWLKTNTAPLKNVTPEERRFDETPFQSNRFLDSHEKVSPKRSVSFRKIPNMPVIQGSGFDSDSHLDIPQLR